MVADLNDEERLLLRRALLHCVHSLDGGLVGL
jgi:hypothetical protein